MDQNIQMDRLQKADRLRKTAGVTYEEALAALEACDGDLLDAVVLLEKQGKTQTAGAASYSTSFEEQHEYIDVPDRVQQQKNSAPSIRRSLSSIFGAVVRFVRYTSFKVTRHDREVFKFPSILVVIAVILSWRISLPVAVIALLFGFRYSFEGEADTSSANTVLSRVGDLAEDVRAGLQREKKDKGGSQ